MSADWVKVYQTVPHDFCDKLVELYDSVPRDKTNMGHRRCTMFYDLDSDPFYPEVKRVIRTFLEKYKDDVKCCQLHSVGTMETPNMIRYECQDSDGPNHFHLHADNWDMKTSSRQISIIIYLNDVTEGGETEFPRLGLKVPPKKGTIVMFPSSLVFMHKGLPPVSNPKYIMVVWLHWNGTGHALRVSPL